ncbi:MAG: hypothetical protein WEB00_08170 [Dehalococcoidia bacterium]
MWARVLFYGGLFVAAWLSLWLILLLIGDYLRTDRLENALESPDGSVNLVLAVVAAGLFALAVFVSALNRKR